MARKKPVDERVRAFVASMLSELPIREDETIDDIERDMEILVDAVADEIAEQRLARRSEPPTSRAACPDCGRESFPCGSRERELATTRGSASLVEPEHYCTACRRSFFPAVDSLGPVV